MNFKAYKINYLYKIRTRMNKLKYWLTVLITVELFQLVRAPAGAMFCFPLCQDTKQCDDITYAGCKGSTCRAGSGFKKPGGASAPFYCQKTPYNYYSGDIKWEPSGFSKDIPLGTFGPLYLPNSNITAKTLTVSPDVAGTCVDGSTTYTFFDLTGPDVFTILHPAVTSTMFFWQVKLIYQVITFDKWDTIYKINTLFDSNISQALRSKNIVQTDEQNLCGNGDKQRYLAIIQDYNYCDKLGFKWTITSTGTSTMKWGVLNIIVSIRLCHPYCEVCFGDKNTQCTICNTPIQQTKLSFQTCQKFCLPGYGDNSTNTSVCIKCTDTNCLYCLDSPTNCKGCAPNYFLYTTSPGVIICVTTCPEHYYGNTTDNDTCFTCDPNCLNCTGVPTNCLNCYPNFFLYQNMCYSKCPIETFANATSQKCQPCDNYCTVCEFSPTNCSVCDRTGLYVSYLKAGTSCVVQCGFGYFPSTNYGMGPNICQGCQIKCKTCDITPYNCSVCNDGYYYLNNTCNVDCPYPEYFKDDSNWLCLDCQTFCVNMTMSLRWKSSLKDQIICDMEFTEPLSWGPLEISQWIKVSTNDTTIDLNSFNFVYEVVSPKIMRLRLSPKGFTFIYNVTFKFKTITFDPAKNHFAANGYRFRDTNYNVSDSLVWFLIKAPSLSETETTIMDSFANISQRIISFTTLPYVQELKKTGVFAMLMGGAQATSTAILVNTIPSQNFYQGVRFWAAFVFFDVPPWEQSSQKSKYMVVPNIDNLIQNARLMPQEIEYQEHRIRSLFDTQTISWRFQRTGYTSFFVFDTYMNIVMMIVCWILLAIAHYLIKHKVHQTRLLSMFYSFTIRVHEITIFYISLTTLMEWMYFEPSSMERWISLSLCILFNVYFLAYELYIYYDMINYPHAQIGNKRYDYYVIRYGSLLKHMRFFEYDPYEEWSMKHWFRPYNYHIMSYYKKFLMMIALPIFYSTKYAQVCMLIIIQAMEIIRFLIIWPFHEKTRNYIRLGLELCLLLFFVSILVQALNLPDIMSGDQVLIAPAVNIYYAIGWLGFVMCFVFNIGHIAIWIYDAVLACRKTNRDLMDEARKRFYMEKLKQYEEENKDVPLGLVNKWVKLGNLNNRKYDVLPDINLRVEYFKITKSHMGFEVDMKKLFEVFMNIEFNFQKQNNIAAGKKLNKRFTLTRHVSPTFYFMIQNIYNQYAATMDFQHITLKTFQKVIQSELEAGQKIILDPLKMQQRIELETATGQKKVIKLHNLLPGFPLSYDDLKQFA